jgi:cytochrome c oxidase cbb3-type subunit 4
MISGIFTSIAFVMFLGVVYWAYTKHNRARFEEAAQLPLEDSVAIYPAPKKPASPRIGPVQGTADDSNLPPCCRGAHK